MNPIYKIMESAKQNDISTLEKLLSTITNLNLIGYDIQKQEAMVLAEGLRTNKSIKKLLLDGAYMTEWEIEHLIYVLEENVSIEELRLDRCMQNEQIMIAIYRVLCVNKTLKSLAICNGGEDTKTMEYISNGLNKNSSITSLSLAEYHLRNRCVKNLAMVLRYNKTLTCLKLYKNKLKDKGVIELLEALQFNTSLETLKLWGISINSEIGNAIANVLDKSRLYSLDLTDGKISADALKSIFSSLLNPNSFVLSLTLGDSKIGKEGAQIIAKVLERKNISLAKLDLSNNDLDNEGICSIVNGLKTSSSLISLDIGKNSIGCTGIEAIFSLLKVNHSLKYLSLQECYFTNMDLVCETIVRGVKSNISLAHLDLEGCRINSENMMKIINALGAKRTSVISLMLGTNNIGDEEIVSVAKMLKANSLIMCISLACNKIEHDRVKWFINTLKENHTIMFVELAGNPGFSKDTESEYRLSKILERNIEEYKLNIDRLLRSAPFNHGMTRTEIKESKIIIFKPDADLAMLEDAKKIIRDFVSDSIQAKNFVTVDLVKKCLENLGNLYLSSPEKNEMYRLDTINCINRLIGPYFQSRQQMIADLIRVVYINAEKGTQEIPIKVVNAIYNIHKYAIPKYRKESDFAMPIVKPREKNTSRCELQ